MGAVQPIVGEIPSAVPARLGVGGMRNLVQEKARVAVVEPEGDAAGADPVRDRGQRRVVGVDDDGRLRRQPSQRRRPLRRDRVELPVAVELVPEQVVQQDHRRLDPAHDLRKRRLVALDDADIGARTPRQVSLAGQSAGDAAHQIRAGAVVGDARPVRLQDVGKHAGDRRLAVGPGDDHGSLR